MSNVRDRSVKLTPRAYAYLQQCRELVPALDPDGHDPFYRTLRGCAELAALLLLRNLAAQAADSGMLHVAQAGAAARLPARALKFPKSS